MAVVGDGVAEDVAVVAVVVVVVVLVILVVEVIVEVIVVVVEVRAIVVVPVEELVVARAVAEFVDGTTVVRVVLDEPVVGIVLVVVLSKQEQAELIFEVSPSQFLAKLGWAAVDARNDVQKTDAAEDEARRARPQLSPPLW
jgi:hypothetical protein